MAEPLRAFTRFIWWMHIEWCQAAADPRPSHSIGCESACTGCQKLHPPSLHPFIMPHRIIWSWYTGSWWVSCHIWYSEEGTGRGHSPPRPHLAVPNVTAHPSTASVPITVLLHNCPLLFGFNVAIKALTETIRTVIQPINQSIYLF